MFGSAGGTQLPGCELHVHLQSSPSFSPSSLTSHHLPRAPSPFFLLSSQHTSSRRLPSVPLHPCPCSPLSPRSLPPARYGPLSSSIQCAPPPLSPPQIYRHISLLPHPLSPLAPSISASHQPLPLVPPPAAVLKQPFCSMEQCRALWYNPWFG